MENNAGGLNFSFMEENMRKGQKEESERKTESKESRKGKAGVRWWGYTPVMPALES